MYNIPVNKDKNTPNNKIAVSWLYSDPDLVHHLRALRRIQFAKMLDATKVKRIAEFRGRYDITFEWKEDVRIRFESIIINKRAINKYFDDKHAADLDSSLINYYLGVRGKIKHINDYIDIKDILLLQHIALEYYFEYGIGPGKQFIQNDERDIKMCQRKEEFLGDLMRLGKELQIRYVYEGSEEISPVVRQARITLEKTHPAIKDYVFNTEAPLLESHLGTYYQVLNKGNPTLSESDGLFLPFDKIRWLKKPDFMRLCDQIYQANNKAIEQRKVMSIDKIIGNINTLLIRDVDRMKTKDMCAMFAKAYDNEYYSSATIKSEIQRVRTLFHIPILSK
jgi:hypothetical protein